MEKNLNPPKIRKYSKKKFNKSLLVQSFQICDDILYLHIFNFQQILMWFDTDQCRIFYLSG